MILIYIPASHAARKAALAIRRHLRTKRRGKPASFPLPRAKFLARIIDRETGLPELLEGCTKMIDEWDRGNLSEAMQMIGKAVAKANHGLKPKTKP